MKNARAIIRALQVATTCLLCCPSLRADDARIWVDAKINGRPVKLFFDTAANRPILFRAAAENLGLRITNSQAIAKVPAGEVPFALTEVCELSLSGVTDKVSFAVVDLPDAMRSEGEDGVLGWPTVSHTIIQFDCLNESCTMLDRLPENVSDWTKFKIKQDADLLTLEFEDKVSGKGSIVVDSASDDGVALDPRRWKEWTGKHPNRNRTINAYFQPAAGLVVQEISWADELSFGSLILFDVPVREGNSAEAASDSSAFIGMAALKRLNLVVDGKKGFAYVQARRSPPPHFPHNRAGVVFTPDDVEKSKYLTAHVLPGTPASEANVRDGDVVLKIDDLDATQWRTDPELKTPNSCFKDRPAGSKVRLTLKRGDKEFETEIVLRDLIGPEVAAKNRGEAPL